MDPTRVLVLANRTVDSAQLRQALLDRSERGPIVVTLLVPAAWEVQDPHGGAQSAQRRLRDALNALRNDGIAVQARLGDADPIAALREAWDPERYDEVIVSTLPSRVSRWLQIDLPRRARKLTGAPVTHVEAVGIPPARQPAQEPAARP
jgi:hypothetical protein